MRKFPDVMCACLYDAQYTHAFYANDATLYMLHTFRAGQHEISFHGYLKQESVNVELTLTFRSVFRITNMLTLTFGSGCPITNLIMLI